MTTATTNPSVFVEIPRRESFRLCRPWLAVALIILVVVQAVLATGAWEYPYARMLIPDVIRTEAGFAFPPQVTVRDHHIVSFKPPPQPTGEAINENP